jgi:hypothetical protein
MAKYGAVLLAALLLGRWFDSERRRLRRQGAPAGREWLTPPGILIIAILLALVAVRLFLVPSSG